MNELIIKTVLVGIFTGIIGSFFGKLSSNSIFGIEPITSKLSGRRSIIDFSVCLSRNGSPA